MLMSLIKTPLHINPPSFKEKFWDFRDGHIRTTPLLRENFPQTYCLIRKIFLGASPPDPLYIGFFIEKILTRFSWLIQKFLGHIKTPPSLRMDFTFWDRGFLISDIRYTKISVWLLISKDMFILHSSLNPFTRIVIITINYPVSERFRKSKMIQRNLNLTHKWK